MVAIHSWRANGGVQGCLVSCDGDVRDVFGGQLKGFRFSCDVTCRVWLGRRGRVGFWLDFNYEQRCTLGILHIFLFDYRMNRNSEDLRVECKSHSCGAPLSF